MNKKEFENLEVGKSFQIGYREYKVMETEEIFGCEGCCVDKNICEFLKTENIIPYCSKELREDKKDVIFISSIGE